MNVAGNGVVVVVVLVVVDVVVVIIVEVRLESEICPDCRPTVEVAGLFATLSLGANESDVGRS